MLRASTPTSLEDAMEDLVAALVVLVLAVAAFAWLRFLDRA
jgi:hypothetical protein